jgi:hypothetical protein
MKRAIAAVALGCAAMGAGAGCAKDPTELIIAVSFDETATRPITSLKVTIDAPGGRVSRPFASLAAVPGDAALDVATFTSPAYLDYLISNDAIEGTVTVSLEARDPFTDDTLLAHGSAMATIARGKTTTTAVALTPDAPPVTAADGGVPDGAADDAPGGDAGTGPAAGP